MKPVSTLLMISLLSLPHLVGAEGFTLTSPDIAGQLSNKEVFNGFGCSGDNISPALNWSNAPEGTKSFALTVYDKDAPTGSGWWHWLVFDLPADTNGLKSNAGNLEKDLAPKGSIQSITSFGQAGFGGACPPEGHPPHQYVFTVYALKVDKLGIDASAMPSLVGYDLNANVLAKASVIAYYAR